MKWAKEKGGEDVPIMGMRPHLHLKFYSEHLKHAAEEEFAEFDAVSRKVFGIAFAFAEGKEGLRYYAPRTNNYYGWQTSGTIGEDGTPRFDELTQENIAS